MLNGRPELLMWKLGGLHSMKRMRVSLRSLLLIVTAIGLLLGYSQHRRRAIIDASNELKNYGYTFAVPSHWSDCLWQRRPTTGTKFFSDNHELLLLDLQNDDEDSSILKNLSTLGVSKEMVEAIQRKEEEKQEQWEQYRALLIEIRIREAASKK